MESIKKISGLKQLLILNYSLLILSSCSVQKQIAKTAKADVLDNKALTAAHVGISIFDPATNKYLYNYQGDKYFVPASNTKIPTCYAAMKYLGDSLVGLRYIQTAHTLNIQPAGDPTFLLSEFKNQPILTFLKNNKRELHLNISGWETNSLGSGWSWNDYQEYYMTERSIMPVFGNVASFSGRRSALEITPSLFKDSIWLNPSDTAGFITEVERSKYGNNFSITSGSKKPTTILRTFATYNGDIINKVLADTLKLPVKLINIGRPLGLHNSKLKTQPTDSLLKPMMHRSDNFFAEQSLLMVSNEMLGVMNDEKIIDTLLKTDFKDLPQKPRWADGSGLSRYNLFTPQSLIAILNKMKNEFGIERLKVILPTGGEGTISNYYKDESGYIFAKTGTLSGVVAFSGFLYTKKGKLLIFSTLVNNHQASSTDVRKAVEKFLQGIRKKY